MNGSVYIFGNFSSGYSQYPDEEYTEAIFRQFSEKSKSPTQVTIHRDGHLMYYSYIRKLHKDGKYIGLCVLLNNGLFTDLKALFSVFENVFTNLVEQGYLVGFNEEGLLIPLVEKLYLSSDEVYAVATSLKGAINNIPSTSLPPENYNISSSSSAEFSIDDNMDLVVKSSYTNGYTYLYKNKSYNTARLNSYKGIVNKMKGERDEYEKRCRELSSDLSKVKAQQRNLKWVFLLGTVVLVLAFILWDKVLFPSEVTHYETNEFIYYGPLKNKKPHGVGVAIYYDTDSSGRHYYIGNFDNGLRQDDDAIMFYKDGSYFKGTLYEDNWLEGTFYDVPLNEYFSGTFKDNNPYTGDWYEYRKVQHVKEGNK